MLRLRIVNKKDKIVKRSKLSDNADIWKNEGKVAYHADGYRHWMVKSVIGYVLRKNNHKFSTEVEFENGRIADIVDLETFLVYECESNASKSDVEEKLGNFWDYDHISDTIVIDPTDAPDDIHEIRDWVEERLVL